MRQLLLFFISCIVYISINAQCLLPSGEPDTLFPVTNVFNTFLSPYYSDLIYDEGATVYNIKSHKSIYYLFGDFTNLAKNQGPALVIDSSTNTVFTPQKWRINGSVKGAIADGSGGFFIYGTFSKIGDSARNYLAQIDGSGKPTAWNPRADAEVTGLYKKGDTLFISGAFSSIFNKQKMLMALYSMSGDSLLNVSLPVPLVGVINCFLVQNDTLILGGSSTWSGGAIRKYNFKDGVVLPWQLAFSEPGEIWHLRFNQDSSCFVYSSDYNGVYLKGVNTRSGTEKFKINLAINSGNFPVTHVLDLEVVGNKAYVVGRFNRITQTNYFTRKGFFAIDATTGAVLPDDIKADGYPTFIEAMNGRLFISGRFTSVSGIKRENFAVIDTGSLQPGNWQLSPSDQLTSLAFSGNKTFIGGYFNGINSVHRDGFAAIDSATNTILPWAPASAGFVAGKRMLISGDTLFILGFTHQNISCFDMMHGNDFTSLLQLVRISTGENISNSLLGFDRINDILIDGNYLYAAGDNQVRRFILPSMTKDPSWGIDFTGLGSEHAPMVLIMTANKLYTVGDNRFREPCTTLPRRKAWLIEYDKATGLPQKFYGYEGANAYYDQVTFEHALLLGDKLYVHGYFNSLNGKSRKNFVLLDVNTGQISDWYTPFSESGTAKTFQWTTDLKWYNNKIFFSANLYDDVQKSPGRGFVAIDTATGQLLPSLADVKQYPLNYLTTERFHDFILDGNNFIGVGDYDSVNGKPSSNIVKMQLVNRTSTGQTNISITGPDTMYVGTTKKFYVLNGDAKTNTYSWSYTGKGLTIQNNRSDTVTLKADSVSSGPISIVPIGYCQTGAPIQRNLVVVMPPLPSLPVVLNVADKCQSASTSYGKLANPPSDVAISITQDGLPLTYNPIDSSFKYFDNWITPAGSHTISVKSTNNSGSSIKDSIYKVQQPTSWTTTISTASTTVCAGSSVTFNATTSISGTHTYQWQVNGANVGTNDSVFKTASLTNGALVKVTVTPLSACITPLWQTSNVITVVVNQNSAPTVAIAVSANNICAGTSVTFTATPTNGGTTPSYQWQVNNVNVGTNSNTFTSNSLNNNDQVKVIMTSNSSCATTPTATSTPITMIVKASTKLAGKASSPVSVCTGTAYNVSFSSTNAPNGSSVQLWENINNGTFTSGTTQTYNGGALSFSVTSNASGTKKYFFKIIPPAGTVCAITNNSDTATTTIDQLAIPVIAVNANTITVTNVDAGASYKWQVENSGSWTDAAPLANGISYTANKNGTYRVQASKGACTGYSNGQSITIANTTTSQNVLLYPNPTTGTLTLDSLSLSDNWEVLDIVNSQSGQTVASFTIINQTKVTVQLEALSNGIYLAVLRRRDGSSTSIQFVKM